MRRIFLIISTLIIIFTSIVIPMKKAHAITPQVAMGAGAGAGYVAVGAYVVGALLVAGGVAVALDDQETSDAIRQHGERVWNTFDTATKEAWQASIDATILAGTSTLAISETMTQSLTDAISLMGNTAQVLVNEKTVRDAGVMTRGSASSHSFSVWVDDLTKAKMTYNGIPISLLQITGRDANYSISGTGLGGAEFDTIYRDYVGDQNKWYFYGNTVYNYQDFVRAFFKAGILGSLPVLSLTDTVVPEQQDYFNDAVDNALNRLKGIKEVSFDPKKWIPVGAGGALLVGGSAGEPLLEDGTPYTGDITWKHPELTLDDVSNPTLDAPAVPIDNIKVGDTPFIPNTTANPPTTTDPPITGDTPGILTGLWDWLKSILQIILDAIRSIPGALTGLLQSIIDAVKAVAGAVVSGLSGSLQAIIDAINAVKAFLGTMAISIANAIGALFLPSEGYFTTFFTDIYNLWSSKIPFIIQLKEFFQSIKEVGSGATLPKIEVDLPERYGGVTMSVIDFSYFEEYRDWILNFIRFTAWFIFLKRLYARIPKVVGG